MAVCVIGAFLQPALTTGEKTRRGATPTLGPEQGVGAAVNSAPEDIELELRRLEETHEESERRLKQLTESRLPTEREIEAALTLSKSLPMLDIEIRRLRLELEKARAAASEGGADTP